MKKRKGLKPVLIIASIAGVLMVGGTYFNLQLRIQELLIWIGNLGPLGVGVYALFYMAACILFIPGSLLTLGAGAIYGVVTGSILVSFSSVLGATAAFLVGRYVARDWIAKKIEGNARFSAIDEAVASEGWKMVGLTRLSPVFSFNLLNYAYGLTRVSLREYMLASWIGMMPGTVMYVYLGSLAGDLASVGAESANAPSAMQWVIRIVGLLATVLVTVYVTKIAKKVLAVKMDG